MSERWALTRRDALTALAFAGTSLGAGLAVLADASRDGEGVPAPAASGIAPTVGDHERDTLVAIARAIYPGAVTGVDRFVRTFLDGRTAARPDHAEGVARTVALLDELGRDWHGGAVEELDVPTRERLLHEVGAGTAEAKPEGTPAERVRYYVVNELLFALYASPTGSELVGLENPPGYPGGLASYQRGSTG